MSKHTPGPWTIARCKCGHCQKYDIIHPFNIDGKFEEADARLIAAAPDLLSVVQTLSEYWDGDEIPPQLIEAARAAIAKAEEGA